MERIYHIIGRKCKLEGRKASYFLLLRNGTKLELVELRPGSDLGLELLRRRCVGYYDGVYHPCRLILRSHFLRCAHCGKRHILMRCLQCKGRCSLPEFVKRKLRVEEEHTVYLAEFGGLLKVGVTKKKRVMERWLEQGADAGSIIEDGSCEEMMKLERHLSAYYLTSIPTFWKVKSLFYKGPVLLQDLRRFYNLPHEVSILPYPNERKLVGRVVGIKGEILVLRKGESYFWVDLDRLIGWETLILNPLHL